MTTYGTYWKLKIQDFDRVQPGFFVSLLARRTDFDLLYLTGSLSGESYVFPDFDSAATAGQAAFRELSRPGDILISDVANVGDVIDGAPDLVQVGRDIVDAEPWRKFLANFATWETSSDPKKYTRQQYDVVMAQMSESARVWAYVQHRDKRF